MAASGSEKSNAIIVWYEGSGTTDRRFLSSDACGSVISVTDGSGALLGINRYDEYGVPQSTNIGRLQYTGQAWLAEDGIQYSKARMYSPALGRFYQPDPVGYEDSPNLYAYVLNDPVNLVDPLGLATDCSPVHLHDCNPVVPQPEPDIVIVGRRGRGGGGALDPFHTRRGGGGVLGQQEGGGSEERIVVIGTKTKPSPPPVPITTIYPPQLRPLETTLAAAPANQQDWCGNKDANAPEGVWAEACRQHDLCYSTPGASKGRCDRRLIMDIIQSCQSVGVSCVGIALLYGGAVWLFGTSRSKRGSKCVSVVENEARSIDLCGGVVLHFARHSMGWCKSVRACRSDDSGRPWDGEEGDLLCAIRRTNSPHRQSVAN